MSVTPGNESAPPKDEVSPFESYETPASAPPHDEIAPERTLPPASTTIDHHSETDSNISHILNIHELQDLKVKNARRRMWYRVRMWLGWENYLLPVLYLSHSLSSTSDRMWAFALPLIFASIYPTSLVPVSVYLFIEKLVCAVLGTYVGYLIDNKKRLPVLLIGLGTQNLSVALSALALFFLYIFEFHQCIERNIYFPFSSVWCCLFWALATLFGTVAAVMSMITDIAVMRDWTVVIAEHHNLKLTKMNSVLRRIDLLTNIFAPLIYGFILWIFKVRLSILVITLWNVLSFFPEFFLLLYVYKKTPPLAQRAAVKKQQGFLSTLLTGWGVYLRQEVTLPSLTYVMIYCTVLSSGVLVLSYLKSIRMHDMGITLFNSIASLFGVIATFVAPYFIHTWGAIKGGVVGFWMQAISLVLGLLIYVVGYLIFNQMWCVYIFLALIIFSRLGLWIFDLSESEIMQEGIAEGDRGRVNAVEKSLTKFAELLIFLLSIGVAAPQYFVVLAIASCAITVTAAVLYTMWSASEYGIAFARKLKDKSDAADAKHRQSSGEEAETASMSSVEIGSDQSEAPMTGIEQSNTSGVDPQSVQLHDVELSDVEEGGI